MLAYKGKYSYDIIIADDGSTDDKTISLLNDLEKKNIIVLHQQNQGPSAARNNAVKHSESEFLLCLDSDNTINAEYIDEGINVLRKNKKAGVAYARPEFMGETNGPRFNTGPFAIEKLLLESYIDMCAVIRREAWMGVGGLDETLWQFEDWEFWIHLYKAGWQFFYVDKVLYKYRIRAGSLIKQTHENGYKKIIAYLYIKHWDLIHKLFQQLYSNSIMYKNDMRRPFRSFIKYSKKKYLN